MKEKEKKQQGDRARRGGKGKSIRGSPPRGRPFLCLSSISFAPAPSYQCGWLWLDERTRFCAAALFSSHRPASPTPTHTHTRGRALLGSWCILAPAETAIAFRRPFFSHYILSSPSGVFVRYIALPISSIRLSNFFIFYLCTRFQLSPSPPDSSATTHTRHSTTVSTPIYSANQTRCHRKKDIVSKCGPVYKKKNCQWKFACEKKKKKKNNSLTIEKWVIKWLL